jgi:hypothetical protein
MPKVAGLEIGIWCFSGCWSLVLGASSSPLLRQVAGEGPEAGEAVAGVNIVFDHVKREVIEAAETPH